MAYEHLFSPICIRGMELRNRVMISSMVTKLAKNKKVTDKLIAYHVARAKGGLGLNLLEATAVHAPSSREGFLSIADDEYIEGMTKLTDAVHAAGGKIGIQLWQGGINVMKANAQAECIIPSEAVAIPCGSDKPVTYPGITREKIHEVVEAYGAAAARAAKSGFDCVEVHLAHGYSLYTFLSAAFNHRTDEYGGPLENRARYALETIDAIRANIPEDMPILMRVVPYDDNLENGLTMEDMIRFIGWAKEHGVDAINLTRGNSATAPFLMSPPVDIERGFNVHNAAKLKEATGVITIATGRINDPDQAEEIIASGKADMVVMARAHIADPEFCNKAKSGHPEDIVRCVGCNQGCNDMVGDPEVDHITCLMNPKMCREAEFEDNRTDNPKKILIVGGGIAGIEAGIVLKERGHNPDLIEETDILGGQFLVAGEAPRKKEFKEGMLMRAAYAEKVGVKVHRNTPFTPEILDEVKPDEVIIAIGSLPIKLNIPNPENVPTYTAIDVLKGQSVLAKTAVVIGGGLTGVEAAEYLQDKGVSVTIVELLPDICKGMGPIRKMLVTKLLEEHGIQVMTSTKCVEIHEGAVKVEKDGEFSMVPADTVVFGLGSKPRDASAITAACEEKGIPYHIIGDAKEIRRAMENCAEGANVALTI